MSHQEQQEFVRVVASTLPKCFTGVRVLEIGSLDLNGSVRSCFSESTYVGIDVGEGPGVDMVCQGQDYSGPSEDFDTVISCEAMEHNPYWLETFLNMIRVCKPGGLVVMTCAATGRPTHGTMQHGPGASPLTVAEGWDYYRNLTDVDFTKGVDMSRSFSASQFWYNWHHFDLYFCGIKRGAPNAPPVPHEWPALCASVNEMLDSYNRSRRSRYRRIAAQTLGDRWFDGLRRIVHALHYWFG